jgi:DNA-binding Lrp family transcriptional regulator
MIDSKDLLIINSLEKDAKASVVAIAKKTGLPATTVHNRIKKMLKDKVITGYTIKVDHKKVGKNISVYIAVTIDYAGFKAKNLAQFDIAKMLANFTCVEEASIITGGTDMLIKVRVNNIEELNKFVINQLRKVDGVDTTQTMVVLQEVID